MRIVYISALLLMLGGGELMAQTYSEPTMRTIATNDSKGQKSYNQALHLFYNKQYSAALALFDKAARESDITKIERETIDFISAICRARLIDTQETNVLDDYINKSTNKIMQDEALVIAANAYAELCDIDRAKEYISKVKPTNLSTSQLAFYYILNGYIDILNKNYSEAEDKFQKTIVTDKSREDMSKYYIGYIYYIEDKLEESAAIFKELSRSDDFPEANLYYLQIRRLQNAYDEVITSGEKALNLPLEVNLKNEITRLIGEANFNTGKYEQTIKNLESYEKGGGKMTRDLYYQLGYSYYKQEGYKEAISHLEKIVTGTDALAQNAYYHLADAYIKTNNKEGAMQAFSMASSFNFEEGITEDALYNFAKLNYESAASNLYTKKIDILKKYIDTYPTGDRNNEIRSYLLTMYINGSNFDQAMIELQKVKNPNSDIRGAVQRLCYQKGIEYFNNRKYKSAISMFNKSLSYPVSNKYIALSSFWKAESMHMQGIITREVIDLYKTYMNLSQPSIREYQMAQYNIGYVYFANKNWKDAITAFESFIKNYKIEDTYLEDAYLRIADAMFSTKVYSAAQLYYKKAADLGKLNPDYANYQQSVSEGLMGRDDLKIVTLKSIVDKGKSSMTDQASVDLAKTYIKTGEGAKAVTVLNKMIKSRKPSALTPIAMLELGVAYSNTGKESDALDAYKRLVKSYPYSSQAKDALIAVKAIYVSQGDANGYIAYAESLGGNILDISEKETLSYEALQRQFLNGNHKKVVELANAYKKNYPKGEHFVDVQYNLVESLIFLQDNGALSAAEELTALPDNQYTLDILEKSASMYASSKNFTKQHETLVRMYNTTVDPSQKRSLLESLMELAVRIGEPEMTNQSITLVFNDKDASSRALDFAHFAKGRMLYSKGSYSEAIPELKASKISHARAEGVQTLFLIADALYKIGDYTASENVIIQMSNLETAHQYWVARGFLLYGDIYNQRGDTFQAKATFQSIIDGYEKPNDGILDSARERISQLEK